MEENQKTYTVSQLNEALRLYLKDFTLEGVWVKGEILDLKIDPIKKYASFLLCEKEEDSDEIVAKIQAMCWVGELKKIISKLKSIDKDIELKDGLICCFKCVVDLWAKQGRIQLVIKDVDPFAILGELHFLRMKVYNELKALGIHEKNKNLPISICPLRIALISAKDGAGYNDFLSGIKNSGFPFSVDFYNCSVQGPLTEIEICDALRVISKRYRFYDVAVIIRGGGSVADLKWFDNKKICLAICNCKVPVLTGIGHEINISAADMVANMSFKTPTAVAVFLENRVFEFKQKISEIAKNIHILAKEKLLLEKSNLTDLTKDISTLCKTILRESKLRLKNISTSIKPLVLRFFKDNNLLLQNFLEKIKIYDPQNTLKFGYTLTRTLSGKVIKSVKEVDIDDSIMTEFKDGKTISLIKNKEVL